MDKLFRSGSKTSLTPKAVDGTTIALRKRARDAQLARTPGVEDRVLRDYHMPPREADRRIVIGEVDVPKVGRVHVEHDQDADEIVLHGVHASLAEIDRDLRDAFVSGAAAFVEAQNAIEQVTARTVVGCVVRAILERHDKFIGAKVRESAARVRFDV